VPDGALSTPGDPVYIAISLRSLMETFDFGKNVSLPQTPTMECFSSQWGLINERLPSSFFFPEKCCRQAGVHLW
jgi:hypothetical protein